VFDGRVVGLQFHLEWTAESLADLIAHCSDELEVPGPFVMSAGQIADGARRYLADCRVRLFALLDDLVATGAGSPGDGGR